MYGWNVYENVDCATDYPNDVECCESFIYHNAATVATCPTWEQFLFTRCYSECEAENVGFSVDYIDCSEA